MSNHPTTMSDVARLARVSVATVSRTLSGDGGSDSVRRRVFEAVAALDYYPNRLPRNMRSRSSQLIGLIISDVANPFFTAVARGCEDVAQAHKFSMVLFNTDEDPAKERASLEVILAERAAGVILASTGQANDSVRRLITAGIPVVALDRRIPGVQLDAVTVDNASGAYLAVQHLIELGHTRVAMVSGPDRASSIRERQEGYIRALRAHRIPVDEVLIRKGNLRETGGRLATADVLATSDGPTAIFAVNNLTTLGVLHALRAQAIKVPEEMSVIGFDDFPAADLLDPPLTAVAQPTYELGARAAELLIRRIRDSKVQSQEVVLPASLIIRASTSSAPGRNSAVAAADPLSSPRLGDTK